APAAGASISLDLPQGASRAYLWAFRARRAPRERRAKQVQVTRQQKGSGVVADGPPHLAGLANGAQVCDLFVRGMAARKIGGICDQPTHSRLSNLAVRTSREE